MRWPWQPKQTFQSGLLRIIEGLENGTVILRPEPETVPDPQRERVTLSLLKQFWPEECKVVGAGFVSRLVRQFVSGGNGSAAFALPPEGSYLKLKPFLRVLENAAATITACIDIYNASKPNLPDPKVILERAEQAKQSNIRLEPARGLALVRSLISQLDGANNAPVDH